MGETTPFARPWRLALASAALALGLIAGCNGDSSDTVTVPATLEQNSGASNVTLNVFPSDEYLANGALVGFTAEQRTNASFLNQLAIAGETGWSTTTSVRIPFSPGPSVFQPSQGVAIVTPGASQVDVNLAAGAVRMYDVTASTATAVAVGEFTVTQNNALTFRPVVTLAPNRTYGVAVRAGQLRTVSGGVVFASNAYAGIQQSGQSSTDAGFAKVAAADPDIETRFDTIAYFQFTTKDDTAPAVFLRRYVSGNILASLDSMGNVLVDVGANSAAVGAQVLAATAADVPAAFAAAGVAGLPTTGIDRIVGGVVVGPQFVSNFNTNLADLTAPGSATLFTNGAFRIVNSTATGPAPPFGDQPANRLRLNATAPFRPITYVGFFPAAAQAGVPVPVVVGLHGLGRSKLDLAAIASAINVRGMALIGIDAYQHGDRQLANFPMGVPEGNFSTKPDAGLAALGVAFPDPFVNGVFLQRSRDKVLQTVVDELTLIRLLSTPGAFDFNLAAGNDTYTDVRVLGQSLGGVLATKVVAVSPAVRRAVINVAGGGIAGIVRESVEISPLNNLALDGAATAPFGPVAGRTDISQFSKSPEREVSDIMSETIIGPIDPLAFAPFIFNDGVSGGTRSPPLRVLLQFALNDRVVPNSANARLARAINAGAPAPTDFPHFVSGRNPQGQAFLFDMGIPTRNVDVDGFTRSGVSQYRGGHGLLFDFPSNAATTFAAQGEAATFLLGAPPFGP